MPTPTYYDFLFDLALDAGDAWPWPGPPSHETFPQSLWARAYANAVVLLRATGAPIAYIELYDVDDVHQVGHVRAYVTSSEQRGLASIEGFAAFIDGAFLKLQLRRLYFESASSRAQQYASSNVMTEEARFRGRLRRPDGYEDLVVNTIYREVWLERRSSFRHRTSADTP